MSEKVSELEPNFGMIQAFGCIDDTHTPMKCPLRNSQNYFGCKQYCLLNVQGVCDYKGMFMDLEYRWSGSVHDSKVFASPSRNKMLRSEEIHAAFQTVIPGCEKIPNYLIGNPAYPHTPFCMKKFDDCNSNGMFIFNNMLRSARNQIQC